TAPVEEMRFEEGTLLVIEVKTTLGKSKTPGFLKTQAVGGAENLQRIQELIKKDKGAWQLDKLQDYDPDFLEKVQAIAASTRSGKSQYVHAQVFFDTKGNPSRLTTPPNGIQINLWN
ncbi:hypothetical protein ABFA30_16260, partial [Pseudomonas sp. HLMP]